MKDSEKGTTEQRRVELHKEINRYKVEIDRTCFVKTKEEKKLLSKLRTDWKVNEYNKQHLFSISA